MRITYYALRDIQVGDEVRHPGDLIPEANVWPFLNGYVNDGRLAPVLVATLPEAQQEMLLDWESEFVPDVEEDTPVSDEDVVLDAKPKRIVKKPKTDQGEVA